LSLAPPAPMFHARTRRLVLEASRAPRSRPTKPERRNRGILGSLEPLELLEPLEPGNEGLDPLEPLEPLDLERSLPFPTYGIVVHVSGSVKGKGNEDVGCRGEQGGEGRDGGVRRAVGRCRWEEPTPGRRLGSPRHHAGGRPRIASGIRLGREPRRGRPINLHRRRVGPHVSRLFSSRRWTDDTANHVLLSAVFDPRTRRCEPARRLSASCCVATRS